MDALNGHIPVLFTRVPVSGHVKTRLSSCLAPEQCAALQHAMTLDLAQRISEGFEDMVLCYSDEWKLAEAGRDALDVLVSEISAACAPLCRVHPLAQRGEGLGERMLAAIDDVMAAGADGCLLMGSDLPDVRAQDVLEARDALADCDVVFGPSLDGGYWIVGLNEPFHELFTRRRYSTSTVLADALVTCERQGKKVRLVRVACDVDDIDDFARLTSGSVAIGPHVAQFLRSL